MPATPRPTPDSFQHTGYQLDGHVLTITLNRPERRNALNWRAYAELEAAFLAAHDDPAVRCVGPPRSRWHPPESARPSSRSTPMANPAPMPMASWCPPRH